MRFYLSCAIVRYRALSCAIGLYWPLLAAIGRILILFDTPYVWVPSFSIVSFFLFQRLSRRICLCC
ncbi:Uncharacterized protein APZ42_026427 [Daphnia magna]|uniref:Uncharacterized protein n=1 Tax=Daphnia magna TaxID=35525 RepID=A0A164S6S3_9CRUS|nr:Uncharacterized protein APZ42_026427 [Daphnia magna]